MSTGDAGPQICLKRDNVEPTHTASNTFKHNFKPKHTVDMIIMTDTIV